MKRYRCFKVADHNAGTNEDRLDRVILGLQIHKSLTEWAWIKHDRDEGRPHIHVAIRCRHARSREEVARYLGVAVDIVLPLSGRGAFPRYLRYLTHEAPDQAHKARYRNDEVHANFDWRAVANGASVSRAKAGPSVDDLIQALFQGVVALEDVYERHPGMAAKYWSRLSRAVEQGDEFRGSLEVQAARKANARGRLMEEEERKHAALQAEQEAEERDRQETERAAHRRAEEKANRDAWLASPEYQEQQRHKAEEEAREKEKQYFRDLVDLTASACDIAGYYPARESGVTQEAVSLGYLEAGEELTVDAVIATFCDTMDIGSDQLAETEAELADFRENITGWPRQIASGELHAADGNVDAFERAMRYRTICAQMPDLYRMPVVREDLPKAWREQLAAIG